MGFSSFLSKGLCEQTNCPDTSPALSSTVHFYHKLLPASVCCLLRSAQLNSKPKGVCIAGTWADNLKEKGYFDSQFKGWRCRMGKPLGQEAEAADHLVPNQEADIGIAGAQLVFPFLQSRTQTHLGRDLPSSIDLTLTVPGRHALRTVS